MSVVDARMTQPDVLDVNCGSRRALDRLADRWTALVVWALLRGEARHGELMSTVTGITQKMLTSTLRSLEADGLVERDVQAGVFPPQVRYRLTELGRSLGEPLGALCEWAQQHMAEVDAHRARQGDGGMIDER
jgi:DNA-binding HxlR family transcriptional regulator